MKSLSFLMMLLRALGRPLSGSGSGGNALRHYKAGVRLHERGRLEEAVAEYTRAIDLEPELAEAYSNRGAAYINLGQPERAIRDLNECIRLQPSLAVAYSNRGFAYNDLRQHERALKDLNQAIRLNPKGGHTYVGRAASYIFLGKEQAAQQDIEQAVKLGFDRRSLEELFENLKKQRAVNAHQAPDTESRRD